MYLRAQDLLVLYKYVADPESARSFAAMGESLRMSASQVHRSVERCVASGLAYQRGRGQWEPARANLYTFAVHGVRFAFATKLGAIQRGVPTAYGMPPLSEDLNIADTEIPVWPHPEGTVRGPSVEPLAKYVPEAALRDPKLHQILALQDTLRIGRARENRLAAHYLASELGIAGAKS